jgi:hypothetical protein
MRGVHLTFNIDLGGGGRGRTIRRCTSEWLKGYEAEEVGTSLRLLGVGDWGATSQDPLKIT